MSTALSKINELPDLHKVEESPVDLNSTYWTPEKSGEYKVGVILGIEDSQYDDRQTGERVALPCVIMLEQKEDGSWVKVRNGAKRLVGAIENALENGSVIAGETPVKIIYLGEMKNKTNSYKSDTFSIRPLILKTGK